MRPDIKEAVDDEALWNLVDTLDEISGIPFDPEEQLPKVWDHRSLAWEELVEIEPRLTTLLDVIHVAIVPPGKEPSKLWYAHIEPRLKILVGYTAVRKNAALRSPAAYDTAYQKLYKELIEQINCEHAHTLFPLFRDKPATQCSPTGTTKSASGIPQSGTEAVASRDDAYAMGSGRPRSAPRGV